ncbi:TVP38/TMEM64 family protein [Massilia cavernae]|uniref:TVP38/TMEM64 family membrane protein n=1 Tax=Massilia cavernae TaxID=2320864 RepID=A0A418Y590_9BURK|nr:TVP38/TMEM64 family protein [Massilia cavernae]RJG21582.1 TVP38/TMEM64 family protein [Massilia cavernae]
MTKFRLIALALIAAAALALFVFGLWPYLTLESLNARQQSFQAYYAAHPGQAIVIYFAICVAVAALSVPGATIVILAGGAMFGLFLGTLIVSFATTIGATLAFLASRHLLRDWVRKRFGKGLAAVDAGVASDGAYYLLTLRLGPMFPFILVNLLMGLTAMRTWTYYWVSQLGMLPITLAFVNAGTQLGRIEAMSDLVSPAVLASLALLAVVPLAGKKVMDWIRARRLRTLKPPT